MPTVLMELQDLLDSIEVESQRTEAVRIISKFLRKWAVQRLDEPAQALRLKKAYDAWDAKKVREFGLSQFGRIRQQATDLLCRLENDNARPGQIQTKHLPEPEESNVSV